MKTIYGEDIGTTDPRTRYEFRHPWPDETKASSGISGLVLTPTGSYQTAFIEVYPPGASFIRGEGKDLAVCEDSAWRHYQAALCCPDTVAGEHTWEARGYRNGAGFCVRCSTFRSEVFTGEHLGQFCHVCGVGTTWDWAPDPENPEKTVFTCEDHKGQAPDRGRSGLSALLHALTDESAGGGDPECERGDGK